MIETLEPLVGEWRIEIRHPQLPTAGIATWEWLRGGNAMVSRQSVEEETFPESVSVILADDDPDSLAMHYFDSRGVARVYRTTLVDGVLKLCRKAEGPDDFAQRFEGSISEDGSRLEGAWHRVEDGDWLHDFDITYTRR